MKKPVKEVEPEFFYIARAGDHYLCGGVAANTCVNMRNVPVWKRPGEYEWARRFISVEKAMKYASDNLLFGVVVVDRAGTVLAIRDSEEATEHD